MDVGRWYKDNSGQEFRYIGTPDYDESIGLFSDGEKTFEKSLSDFENVPKEKKLFGFFKKGGITANDLLEARSFFGEEEWKKLKKQDKINSARYLKRTGKIGYKKGGKLPEPEESQEFYAAMQYDNGGMTLPDWLAKKMSEVTHYDVVVVAKSKPSGREGWLSSVTYETRVEAGSLKEAEEKAEREFKKLYPNESIAYINAFADTSAFIPTSYAKGGEISWDEYIKPMIQNLNKLLNSGKIKIEDYTRAVFNLKNPKYAEGGELKEDFLEDMQELHNDIKEITLRDGSKISHEELMEAHFMAEDDDDDDDDDEDDKRTIMAKGGKVAKVYELLPYKKHDVKGLITPKYNERVQFVGSEKDAIMVANEMIEESEDTESVELSVVNINTTNPLKRTKKIKMVFGEGYMADGGWIDEVTRKIEEIKKKYPNSEVSYYFAKNGNGKNYVIEAKENGKVVYSSYQQNKMADGGELDTFSYIFQKFGFEQRRGAYGVKKFYKRHNNTTYYGTVDSGGYNRPILLEKFETASADNDYKYGQVLYEGTSVTKLIQALKENGFEEKMADGGEVTFGKSREDKFYNVKESIENGKVVFRGKMAEGGEIVTDRAEVQKIKNSIQEGELILRAGKSYGRKLNADELESIRESVNRSRKRIGLDETIYAKGGKTPVVVRTQFEEEEFEYKFGGILADMSNRDKAKVFSFLDEYAKSNEVSTWWDYFGYTKEQADDIEKGWARSRGYMGKGGKISKYDDGAFAGYKMNRGGKDWFIIRHKSYDTGKIMWNVYANTVDGENFVDGFNNKYSAIYYIKNIYTNPDWQ